LSRKRRPEAADVVLVEAAAVEAVITLSKALLDSVVVWPEHLCSLAGNNETVVGMGRMLLGSFGSADVLS
jgi:hypothetical protein